MPSVQWELSLSVAFGRSLRPTYEPFFFSIFAWHLLGTLGGSRRCCRDEDGTVLSLDCCRGFFRPT